MPRLSIVIPCVQDAVFFESTLASVLQNRPADCEVLVVQPRAYDDPYELGGEVRFLQAPADSSTVDLINVGIQSATGADRARPDVRHRGDRRLDGTGAGSFRRPDGGLCVAAGGRRRGRQGGVARRAICRGWTPQAARQGRIAMASRRAITWSVRHCRPVSTAAKPCWTWADSVAKSAMNWPTSISRVALRAIGLRAVHEETQRGDIADACGRRAGCRFEHGRQAERLFWRNAAAAGWSRALLSHPWTLVGEVAATCIARRSLLQLLGRAVATCEFAAYRRHRRHLEAVREALRHPSSGVLPFKRLAGQRRSQIGCVRARRLDVAGLVVGWTGQAEAPASETSSCRIAMVHGRTRQGPGRTQRWYSWRTIPADAVPIPGPCVASRPSSSSDTGRGGTRDPDGGTLAAK